MRNQNYVSMMSFSRFVFSSILKLIETRKQKPKITLPRSFLFRKFESHGNYVWLQINFSTLPLALETCSIYQNVYKHLVNNVSKYFKDCFSSFGDARWFSSPPFFLTLFNIYCLSFDFKWNNFVLWLWDQFLSLYNPYTVSYPL